VLIDVQHSSAHADWPSLRSAAQAAEARGADTVWVFDHFDGAMIGGDLPVLEAVSLLGALAAATSTIGIGAMVFNVANRHPAVLAAAARSLQHISSGRLRIGLGAGTAPGSRWAVEHEGRGIPLLADRAERHQRVVLQIEAIRSETDAPIIVGANTVALATLAGRHADGVNVRLTHERAAEFVAASRQAAGSRPFEISAYTVVTAPGWDEASARRNAAALGVDRLIMTVLGAP
jgi:alkanesulfonate monooxygenase SsuD/methylene tetrahydromethanopterin reductase-like flavin-dependent oxidoreductase (luciferase family)